MNTIAIRNPEMLSDPATPYCTYSIFLGETLLYVGSSGRLAIRLIAHLKKPRFSGYPGGALHCVVTQVFPTREAAYSAETHLIETLNPLLNMNAGTSDTKTLPLTFRVSLAHKKKFFADVPARNRRALVEKWIDETARGAPGLDGDAD